MHSKKSIKAILDEYKTLKGESAVIATVVNIQGSAYRSAGARMLIRNDGRWLGSISGGCLEGDALRKAKQVMQNGSPMIITYDTTLDNGDLGVNLGCEGVIDILFEPANDKNNNIIAFLFEILKNESACMLSSVIRSTKNDYYLSQRILLDDSRVIKSTIEDSNLLQLIKTHFKNNQDQNKSTILNSDEADLLLEVIKPTENLLIFGGGIDARPVAELANKLGWNVSVFDDCIARIMPSFFPKTNLNNCSLEEINTKVKVEPHTAAIIMSHNYRYDLAAFKMLLSQDISYIGLLGPKKKSQQLVDDLEKENVKLTQKDFLRIFAPVGLDIGAETAEEIALSIISEIQAHFNNRNGGFLKNRKSPIHNRLENFHFSIDKSKALSN